MSSASLKSVAVSKKTVHVAVLAGQDAGPRWTADRIRAKRIVKHGTLLCDPVQMRRLIDFRAVGTDRLRCMIVGENEHDIRLFCECGRWHRKTNNASVSKRKHLADKIRRAIMEFSIEGSVKGVAEGNCNQSSRRVGKERAATIAAGGDDSAWHDSSGCRMPESQQSVI